MVQRAYCNCQIGLRMPNYAWLSLRPGARPDGVTRSRCPKVFRHPNKQTHMIVSLKLFLFTCRPPLLWIQSVFQMLNLICFHSSLRFITNVDKKVWLTVCLPGHHGGVGWAELWLDVFISTPDQENHVIYGFCFVDTIFVKSESTLVLALQHTASYTWQENFRLKLY